jgi:hypothetical protein
MYRYRSSQRATHDTEKKLGAIAKLGKVLSVKGYRFKSTRSYLGSEGDKRTLTTTYECVLVRGVNGSARFYSTWGYSGSGPHLTKKILMACGLNAEDAWKVASTSPRKDDPGTDWEIKLTEDARQAA